ncbi:MAG: phenolic acid decarboxylase subunit D [Nostoc sp. NMS2]|uniref:non-oxidative hydroxyarylic acid decarboxylases subunit D n=1 Tax=Nostoc sp. NMS2 TaxID=2815389 RepID=UPI0025D9EF15|nr:non-oxidative hydroxyarylic acid decarboxylases subunit D [Nostoc sp. NMS2]MBN3994051.1 phenolic acid decarboxylase subunit D [Nostoc sp. NMS2]
MSAPDSTKEIAPSCPRCDSTNTEIITKSPVPDIWVVYGCRVCFYGWRSTEPDYATDSRKYNPQFKINPADIPNFSVLPTIPKLRDE